MQTTKIKEKYQQFEKRIKAFVTALICFIDRLPRDRSCAVIGTQLMRSGTSVRVNYLEARAASSKKEFCNYFGYSLQSANDPGFWLEVLMDAEKSATEDTKKLLSETNEIANIFAKSIMTLKDK